MIFKLVELRRPPITVQEARNNEDADLAHGILKNIVDKSPVDKLSLLQEATKSANDLSGLVRRKKPAQGESQAAAQSSKSDGKRPLDQTVTTDEANGSKKAKKDDAESEI